MAYFAQYSVTLWRDTQYCISILARHADSYTGLKMLTRPTFHMVNSSDSQSFITSVVSGCSGFGWDDAPPPKTNPHICNVAYDKIMNFNQDLADLVATCQRHTRCSVAYCLCTHDGQQKCHFAYLLPSGRIAGLRVVTILSTYLVSSSFAVSAPSAEATICSMLGAPESQAKPCTCGLP